MYKSGATQRSGSESAAESGQPPRSSSQDMATRALHASDPVHFRAQTTFLNLTMAAMKETILGFGNPLLDISATVEQAVLDEWGASLNNAILAEEKHQPLYKKLTETHKVDYIAGGATLNSIRVAQWMLGAAGKKGNSHYIGCIGKDAFGETMKTQLKADGVAGHFMEVDGPTGTCAVLVKDNERSLIANLAAAEKYDFAHFESTTSRRARRPGSRPLLASSTWPASRSRTAAARRQ